jgi:hypothetical protein
MHTNKAGQSAVLICLEQADTTEDKNVLIGESHVAPDVEMNSWHKVVLENDDQAKNKLKIIAKST